MNNGIVIRPLKLVYWYIPKNACTSFKKFFADYLGLSYDYSDVLSVHAVDFEAIRPEQIHDFRDFLHFAVVRNPLNRLYSLYRNKIRPDFPNDARFKNGIEHAIFKDYPGKFWASMTFNQFVDSILSIPDHQANVHFKLQSKMLPDVFLGCEHGFKYRMLQFEDLNNELKRLSDEIGERIVIDSHNATTYTEQDVLIRDNTTVLAKVFKYYRSDYFVFNY